MGSDNNIDDIDIHSSRLIELEDRIQVDNCDGIINELVHQLPTCMMVLDVRDYSILNISDECHKLLGYDIEYIRKKYNGYPHNILSEHELGQIKSRFIKAIECGEMYSGDINLKKANGRMIYTNICAMRIADKIYINIIDITKKIKLIKESENEKIFNQIINDISTDLIFAIDIGKDMIKVSGSLLNKYPIKEKGSIRNFIIDNDQLLYEEDIATVIEVKNKVLGGIEEPFDIRLVNKSGIPEWYEIKYRIIYDGSMLTHILGRAINIQRDRTLIEEISLDSLTGCLNKGATEDMVDNILSSNPKESHALFMIDIDNFKGINDNLGHPFGDMVLTEIATEMKNLFRGNDFVGRVGGDEFVVFLRSYNGNSIVYRKAEALVDMLYKTYGNEVDKYSISGSVGVALYPEDGKTYKELFSKADIALYTAKDQGKGRYYFYNKSMNSLYNVETPLESDTRFNSNDVTYHMIMNVLNLLSGTRQLSVALREILRGIGNNYSADRIYILEISENNNEYRVNYEWFSKLGSKLTKDFIACYSNLSVEIDSLYSEDNILVIEEMDKYSDDIISMYDLAGIKSTIQCKYQTSTGVEIVIGIGSAEKSKKWLDREKNTFRYICKLIGVYLYNYRIEQKL